MWRGGGWWAVGKDADEELGEKARGRVRVGGRGWKERGGAAKGGGRDAAVAAGEG